MAEERTIDRRWGVATLLTVAAAAVASSAAIAEGAPEPGSGLGQAILYCLLLLGGWKAAGRIDLSRLKPVAVTVVFIAISLAPFVPLLAGARLEDVGPMHLVLLQCLRNVAVLAGVLSRDSQQRRTAVYVSMILAVLSFSFSGSLAVLVASLGCLGSATYWLACREARRWSPRLAGHGSPAPIRSIALTGAALFVCFAMGVVLYPNELSSAQALNPFADDDDSMMLTQEDILERVIERSDDIEEMTGAIGSDASGSAIDHALKNAEDDQLPRFSTVRNAPSDATRALRQVFRVAGPSAAHLPSVTYDKFDGVDWKPELSIPNTSVSWLLDQDSAVRKEVEQRAWDFGRRALASGATAEDFLEQARAAMTDWLTSSSGDAVAAEYGGVSALDLRQLAMGPTLAMADPDHLITRYDLESIAQSAVLDPQARDWLLNLLADESGNPDSLRRALQQWRLAQGGAVLPAELLALVNRWRKGSQPGWPEIDAVVQGLRGHAEHDPTATAPPGVEDTVKYFLTESKRGTDYLFASSAVVLLRGIGYPSRLVAGFVAKPERYNRFTDETAVYEDDLHYWAQVRLGPRLWVDVEPTPGFDLKAEPPVIEPVWRVASRSMGLDRPGVQVALAAAAVALVAAYTKRRRVLAFASWLAWRSSVWRSKESLVRATCRLMDRRARAARRDRPCWLTTASWIESLTADDAELREASAWFRELSDEAAFSPGGLQRHTRVDVAQRVDRLVRACSVRRLNGLPCFAPSTLATVPRSLSSKAEPSQSHADA